MMYCICNDDRKDCPSVPPEMESIRPSEDEVLAFGRGDLYIIEFFQR